MTRLSSRTSRPWASLGALGLVAAVGVLSASPSATAAPPPGCTAYGSYYACPDTAITTEGTQVAIPVLTNDSPGFIRVGYLPPVPNGSIAFSPDEKVLLFTPSPGFSGVTSFSYRAYLNVVESAQSTVTVTVNAVTAPPTSFSTVAGSTVTVGTAASGSFVATGKPAPTYAVTAGALPPGLTLSASGVLTGTPTTAGDYSFDVTATNSVGSFSQSFAISAQARPSAFSTATLDDLVVGTPAQGLVQADGHPAPRYTVAEGQLPDGLTVDEVTGVISGTPTVAGPYSFIIVAGNAAGSAQAAFSGLVSPAPAAPTAFTSGPPEVVVAGGDVSGSVVADGYPAPAYAVTAGVLPTGLDLDPATGALTGVPTAPGDFAFTVTATNASGSFSAAYVTRVTSPVTQFTASRLGPLVVGQPAEGLVQADGFPAAVFTVIAGTLPAGLSLDTTTGVISGTPTTAGPYAVTVRAHNELGHADAQLTGTVLAAAVAPARFTDATIAPLVAGVPVTDGVLADGAPAPTYAVTKGALPTGLTLDAATGALTGTPTTPGAYTFAITASNAGGTLSRTFSGTVAVPATTQLPASSGALDVSVTALSPGGATELVATGYKPGSTVTFVIYSTPLVLGTAIAGADGVARLTVVLPADVPVGAHTVVSLGEDPLGNARVMSQQVQVAIPAAGPAQSGQAALAVTGAGSGTMLAATATGLLVGTALLALRRRIALRR